ncbi:hypothetical protein ACFWWM_42495 [Streptomyces sp. NPDC058682]|uniref:hypothetical protein n=1 Tax=Streptomyces sp. NPDC058682 TaxID=3346596 RepID=UPI003664C07D
MPMIPGSSGGPSGPYPPDEGRYGIPNYTPSEDPIIYPSEIYEASSPLTSEPEVTAPSGDLYATDFGPLDGEAIKGGSLEFKPNGRIHHSVFGLSDGGRFSWDLLSSGEVTGDHFTDQGYPKSEKKLRHPFENGDEE